MAEKSVFVFYLLYVNGSTHVGIDLKGFIGIYSRHCSTSKLLTVLFCLTYTLERLSPGVLTFKHPPLTWIGAVVLSHEVMDL